MQNTLNIEFINFVSDYININSKLTAKYLRNLTPLNKNQLTIEFKNLDKCVENLIKFNDYFNPLLDLFYYVKDISLIIHELKNGAILHETELFEIKYFNRICKEISNQIEKLNVSFEHLTLFDIIEIDQLLGTDEGFMVSNQKLNEIREKKLNDHKNHLQLAVEEAKEELNERKNLSKKLSPFAIKLNHNLESLAKIEFTIQKAIMAKKLNLSKPKLSNKISFKNLINPLVNNCVGISGEFNLGTTVITGANMGGKTTLLKTVYLNIMLAHFGFYVFAEDFHFPYLHFINFVDNLPKPNLSSFATQVSLVNEAYEKCLNESGIVFVDEFAFGTNAEEGKKIFCAFSSCFNKLNSFTLLTTHFDKVAQTANAHYQIGENYKLFKTGLDAQIPQYAIKICKQLAINSQILDKLV